MISACNGQHNLMFRFTGIRTEDRDPETNVTVQRREHQKASGHAPEQRRR